MVHPVTARARTWLLIDLWPCAVCTVSVGRVVMGLPQWFAKSIEPSIKLNV